MASERIGPDGAADRYPSQQRKASRDDEHVQGARGTTLLALTLTVATGAALAAAPRRRSDPSAARRGSVIGYRKIAVLSRRAVAAELAQARIAPGDPCSARARFGPGSPSTASCTARPDHPAPSRPAAWWPSRRSGPHVLGWWITGTARPRREPTCHRPSGYAMASGSRAGGRLSCSPRPDSR